MAIVVAFLDSAEGDAAWSAASEYARALNESVVIVPLDEAAAQRAAQRADESVRVLAALTSTDRAEEFLDAAHQADARLVILGLRRRSPVGKLILGASAQRILLDSAVPVLTVKGE